MTTDTLDDLHWAHPLVREWFLTAVGVPTEPQKQGWPAILAGKNTLISAPTGSGKTFAAFLTCIDHLVRQALAGDLKNETEVLYVSPLKALSNDIHINLTEPLEHILKLAKERGFDPQEIRVAVRTGDTLQRERQSMLKKPPHILVTTPESLYILLTAEKSRDMLKNIKTVIVDEIHAMLRDKRGAHLSLSLERLEALTEHKLVRIGLSATQKPIDVVAAFLIGNKGQTPTIINIGHKRDLALVLEVPGMELGAVASNEMWDEIYDKVATLARQHRSTLIFVNTRRLAERVAHHLSERLGEDEVAAHHGSLSRKIRLAAETKLKHGKLKALVATASLELGIDIGSVDLVCQLGSPRAIAVALQRVGRAGHWHGGISKGHFFATTRDELLECAALIHAIKMGELDTLILPKEPIDILAQQLIATCATGEWHEDELFNLIKKAFPYKNLQRETFDAVLLMLASGVAGSRGRYGSYLYHDRVNKMVKARRGSRLTAIMSGGAIPDNGLFTVIAEPNEVMVGTLDEDFAIESNRGDIILLGTTSWQIKRIEANAGRVLVEDAHGAPPSVPFWRGEAPSRTQELSLQVAQLRQYISDQLPAQIKSLTSAEHFPEYNQTITWLKQNCSVDQSGAEQLIDYILQGRALLGAVPTQKTIIAERFFDEGGGMQLVIHAPFGARINKAWGLALRKRFCRSFNFELQAAATDNGLNISLAEQHSFPLADVFQFLHPNSVKDVLVQAVLQSPLFATRWRWTATRSLTLVRFRNGKKVPPNILRMLSDDLLAAVFPDAAACQDNLGGQDIILPDHPLINETIKDALMDALDLDGLMELLKLIDTGEINCIAIDTPTPSVFAHEILNANPFAFLDDAPLEERRARAVSMRRFLPDNLLQEIGKLDPEVIAEIKREIWPDVRDADELHDVLQTLIAFPADLNHTMNQASWQHFFSELISSRRAVIAMVKDKKFWLAADKVKSFLVIYPEAIFLSALNDIEEKTPTKEEAILNQLRGWFMHLGPTDASELSDLLSLEISTVEQALVALEATGLILRGHFIHNTFDKIEWCERRLLARIHQRTLGNLRRSIEPVTALQYVRWLLKWQHVVSGSQLQGVEGLFAIIKQLQGFELPANAWEEQIFAKRVLDYDKEMLDQLCLSGRVSFGRLSNHPAFATEEAPNNNQPFKKRVMPTSIAPITFFVRKESDWISPRIISIEQENLTALPSTAQLILDYLQKNGASFFIDIQQGIAKLKSEVETGLWILVTAGLITADGFDNLRALIDPKRRLDKQRRLASLRYQTGRFSLLRRDKTLDAPKHIEAICWMLLNRYGVIFRDVLAREKNIPRWREILMALRRLEDRGEIRGGRFVSGFLGEQFALPYAVDSLRTMRKEEEKQEEMSLSAVDPLNLIGIILPGARIPAISGKKIHLCA